MNSDTGQQSITQPVHLASAAGLPKKKQGKKPVSHATLGLRTGAYPLRPILWRDFFFLFLPAAVAVIAPIIYAWQLASDLSLRFGPAAAFERSKPWLLLAAIGSLALLLLALIRLRQAQKIVYVHEGGLLIRNSLLFSRAYPWNQLTGISVQGVEDRLLGRGVAQRLWVRLERAKGRPIRLSSRSSHLSRLVEDIKSHLFPRLAAEVSHKLESGERIRFGDLTISRAGLQWNKLFLDWIDVQHLHIAAGKLIIEPSHGQTIQIPTGRITNAEILLMFVSLQINQAENHSQNKDV